MECVYTNRAGAGAGLVCGARGARAARARPVTRHPSTGSSAARGVGSTAHGRLSGVGCRETSRILVQELEPSGSAHRACERTIKAYERNEIYVSEGAGEKLKY